MKKIYISCPKHLEPVLKAEAKANFQNLYVVQDNLEESDLVYVIGEVTTSMEREIVQANRSGIPLVYANEKFQSKKVYEGICDTKMSLKIKTKEKAHDLER